MIKSMVGVAARFLKQNKLMTLTSIVGVMISMTLIITLIVFIANANQSLSSMKSSREIEHDIDYLSDNLSSLFPYIIVLSILVIIMTALFIISNFDLFLYKYRHQLAILRSIGATRWQVFRVILFQSTFINLLGTIFAMIFSFFMYGLLFSSFEKLLSIEFITDTFNFKLAMIVGLISFIFIQSFMLIPAYRSSRYLPVTILQKNESVQFSHEKLIKKVSFIVITFSALLVVLGNISTEYPLLIAFGSLLFLLSTIMLTPFYFSPLVKKILPTIRRLFGNVSFVAVKNTIPQVKKNSWIVLIITAMLVIGIFGTTLLQTAQKGGEAYVKQQYETEIVILNESDRSTINAIQFVHDIEEIHEINAVSTLSKQQIGEAVREDRSYYFAYSFANLTNLNELGLINVNDSAPLEAVVKTSFAEEHHINEGDTLTIFIQFDNEMQLSYLQNGEITVSHIVDEFPFPDINDILIDWETTAVDSSFLTFERAYVEAVNPETAMLALNDVIQSTYPEVRVNSLENALKQSEEMATQRWVIFLIVLMVILMSVMLGVINTLMNHFNSKRKEFTILRVIYMNEKDIVRVIMTQIFTYITYSIVFGILIGLLFTYLIGSIDPAAIMTFNSPMIFILVILVYFIILAVIKPVANRLSRLNIQEELTKE